MPVEDDQSIPEVEAILASLADVLEGDDRVEFDDDRSVIGNLLAPKEQFSVETYVASEVARALRD